MPKKLQDYEVLGVIGTGSSGTCYKVCHKITKKIFVWKAIDYGNLTEEQKQLLISEVNLLKSLEHPNIVKYCGRIVHKETTTLYIITEWCEGGDLYSWIKNAREKGKYMDEQFIWRMLYQISRAIQACHNRLVDMIIFHRDIKPANVYIDSYGNAKLGDFGLARAMPEKSFSETIVGTPYYMSPELMKGGKYNIKTDIWALGCLVYELCALRPPFNGPNMLQLRDTIKRGKYLSIPPHYSNNLREIISLMLRTEHEFRPSIEMILHHPSLVINIKSDQENFASKPLQNANAATCMNPNPDDLANLTLVEPEEISNKVFKEKWAEKHEALKEKEAWLKKREKSIGYKEKSVANREKHVQLMETHVKQKQDILKKKKVPIGRENKSGHETDATVNPADTPIRSTSAKLDPTRFPRPSILTNACKQLEKNAITNNNKTNKKNDDEINKKIPNVRRALTLCNGTKITTDQNKNKNGIKHGSNVEVEEQTRLAKSLYRKKLKELRNVIAKSHPSSAELTRDETYKGFYFI